jgi:hypothetical protein
MSGGRLFYKSVGLRLIPPEHALRAAEEGTEISREVWRVPMRRRISLEGDVEADTNVSRQTKGMSVPGTADVAMMPPLGLGRRRMSVRRDAELVLPGRDCGV